ncbi:MAG: class II aldolase/adducin family protein [Actinobacteria bacterium]|nr:class II aldolase/adducin family protein [Actinomycetota bacterium]
MIDEVEIRKLVEGVVSKLRTDNIEVFDEKEIQKLSRRIVNATKRLHSRGILSGTGGNISMRTSNPNHILISPTGIPIRDMFPDDLCLVDISKIFKDEHTVLRCKYQPTSEILIHSRVYYKRPEVKAIIHSHPPMVTAYACTNQKINFKIQEDQRYYIGDIEYLPFVYSSTRDLADAAVPKLEKNYVLVLRNHGVFVLGDSLCEAVNITELVEDLASISFYAKLIGNGEVVELPREYWEEYRVVPRHNLIYRDEVFD